MKPKITITETREIVVELPEDTVLPTITTHPYGDAYEVTPEQFRQAVMKLAGFPEFSEPKTMYKIEWV